MMEHKQLPTSKICAFFIIDSSKLKDKSIILPIRANIRDFYCAFELLVTNIS